MNPSETILNTRTRRMRFWDVFFSGPRPRRTHLITGTAARLQPLSVMSAAVKLSVLVEIDQIHQQLLTHGADETLGVPVLSMTRSGCKDHNVSPIYLTTTLGEGRGGRRKQRESTTGTQHQRRKRKSKRNRRTDQTEQMGEEKSRQD